MIDPESLARIEGWEEGVLHGLNIARDELTLILQRVEKKASVGRMQMIDVLLSLNVKLNRLILTRENNAAN